MLDLADDCSRFVSGYFEIISASSPHIYHSALVLTPKTSIIRKLYESHAQPFTRVIHGMPESWDSNTAAAVCPFDIGLAVWSPCNRFIAVSPGDSVTVDVLDSATLQRLQSFNFSSGEGLMDPKSFVFSPDSRTVTCFIRHPSGRKPFVVSWDLQTGCIVSAITCHLPGGYYPSSAQIAYSTNGKTVAVLYSCSFYPTISIYNVATGVFMHNVHHSDLGDISRSQGDIPASFDIWTHGESLRFVTPGSRTTINIWEVGLAPGARPITVETHSVPKINQRSAFERDTGAPPIHTRFFPVPSRLALICGESLRIMACGARDSELLICDTKGITFSPDVTFSSDGRFFACPTADSVYLWMESSTGYVLHAKLTSGAQHPRPLLSPNGESIVTLNGPRIRLWHTKTLTTPSAGISTGTSRRGDFVVEFHPNLPLGIVVRQGDNVVTILDLNSGVLQLTIDTGMEVYGLRVTEGTVVVIGREEVVTWNLPGGSTHPDARMEIKDGTKTITLIPQPNGKVVTASISPNLSYIARVEARRGSYRLSIYESSPDRFCNFTGCIVKENKLWFAPDERNIFVADGNEGAVEEISRNRSAVSTPVANIDSSEHPSWRLPWSPPRGHRVTGDGWILGLNGRRLLLLPPPWRSSAAQRVWSGQFLALLHELPEAVILELEQ